MKDPVLISAIIAFGSAIVVATIGGFFLIWKTRIEANKVKEEMKQEVKQVTAQLIKLEVAIDGNLQKFLKLTEVAFRSIGLNEGKDIGRTDLLAEQKVITDKAEVKAEEAARTFVPVVAPVDVLDNIEKNTKEISENTKDLKPKTNE